MKQKIFQKNIMKVIYTKKQKLQKLNDVDEKN